jgi:hypothetical protein
VYVSRRAENPLRAVLSEQGNNAPSPELQARAMAKVGVDTTSSASKRLPMSLLEPPFRALRIAEPTSPRHRVCSIFPQ